MCNYFPPMPLINNFTLLTWSWQIRSKTHHPVTCSSSRLSTKWKRNSPYLMDQKPRTGPLMMDASTSKPNSTSPEVTHHNLVTATHYSFKGDHNGHLCTIALLSKDYRWPGLSTYIQKYISDCAVCIQSTHPPYSPSHHPPHLWGVLPFPKPLCGPHYWPSLHQWSWLCHGCGRPWP